jgi:tetratricopeptide (TPR) repeat protein
VNRSLTRTAALSLVALCALLVPAASQAKDKGPVARPFEITVVDATGAPVAGVLVAIKDSMGTAIELSAAGIADAAGKVTGNFPDQAAAYAVDLSKERFRPQHQTIDLSSQKLKKGDTAVIRFTLEPVTAIDDYSAAVKAIQAKDMAAAESSLRLAVATDPAFVKGHEVLAMVLLEAKKFEDGLAEADKTLALDPANLSALRSRYDALSGLGRAADAEAALGALAEKDRSPDIARLLYNAGATAMNNKEREKSRAYLQQALTIDPNLYQAHSALAEIAIGDKNYDEAVRELDLVIGIAPRNFKAYERKIEVLKAAGKTADADAAEKALAALKGAG